MTERRSSPFIWATWLAKVMSGDSDCQWGSWFQTHNRLTTEQLDDPMLAVWMVEHNRLLTDLQQSLRRRGLKPQLGVTLTMPALSNGAVLKGKVDCLTVEDSRVTVYDCKAGRQRNSDTVQVQIYMLALSRMRAFAGKTILGSLRYKQDSVAVPPLADSFVDNFDYFVELLAGDDEPIRAPGSDCRFCKITLDDCPERTLDNNVLEET